VRFISGSYMALRWSAVADDARAYKYCTPPE